MTDRPPFRVISKDKYIVAGIITLLIFCLGLTLGFIIDDHRYNLVEEVNMQQEVKFASVQLQYLYLTTENHYNYCPTMSATLKETVKDLSDSLAEVISFEEENEDTNLRKEIIMRRYLLDNLRYYLLATQSKAQCDLDIVPILYFYQKDCPSCSDQGIILTYYKQIFGEKLLVFPINSDFRDTESMVRIVETEYNITRYPTIVVDGVKHEGVVSQVELGRVICSSLKQPEADVCVRDTLQP